MQKLLVKGTIFVLVNLTLLVAAEMYLPDVMTSAVYKRQIIESHLDAETLVLGSSHTLIAIAPHLLTGRSVSLANNAQDLYYDTRLANIYAPRMPHLRRIIVEVCYFSWEYSLANNPESWRQQLYELACNIPPAHTTWNPLRYSRLLTMGSDRMFKPTPEPNPFQPDGWGPASGTLDPATGKEKADLYTKIMRPELRREIEDMVTDFIQEMNKRGVEVVFVQTPAHICYRSELNPDSLARMKDSTSRVVRNSGVHFLDYFADNRFTDTDFSNGDHLNEQGARKFTTILDRDLLEAPATPMPK